MEQRDQTPEQPGEDMGRAAAEAMAEAEQADHGYHAEPAPEPRSKRWFVVGGVTVAALALAGTAAAIAGHSHGAKTGVQNVAAAGPTQGSTTSSASSPQQTPTVDGTSLSPTPASSTPPPTTAPKTSPTSPTTSKPSPSKPPTSSPPPAGDADGQGGDCETTSHDTAADEAVAFSGMTKGTQQAFLAAKKGAQAAGLSFVLNSGYRSAAYQQRVFDCWVKQLGSTTAARKYALPPSESAHVQGYAMDIAPPPAASWLESTAGKYGLCRRYADETWHFEYQSRYKTQGCPSLLPHP